MKRDNEKNEKIWKRTKINKISVYLVVISVVALSLFNLHAQEQAITPEIHFHHLHLNTLDPKAAIDFYTSKFDCEKARFAGAEEAVWAQKSWLLFNKVDKAPAWELTSA